MNNLALAAAVKVLVSQVPSDLRLQKNLARPDNPVTLMDPPVLQGESKGKHKYPPWTLLPPVAILRGTKG